MEKNIDVGKLLLEAGKHYGDGIIKEYSKKLIVDLGKNIVLDIYLILENFLCFQKCTQWVRN